MGGVEFVRRAADLGGVDDSGLQAEVGREAKAAATFAVSSVVETVDVGPFESGVIECGL